MPNQDQNLVYGWHTQKLGATAGQTGFAQVHTGAPASPSVSTSEQVSAGAPVVGPNPAVTGILVNPGYVTPAAMGTPLGVAAAPAVPATTVGIQNPYGTAMTVAISGGTVTVVSVAPNTASGAGTYQQVAAATGVQVTVAGGGWIKLTYSAAPTWAWTGIN